MRRRVSVSVVSKQFLSFTVKSRERYCAGKKTKTGKNNLAFKYLVDICCCQDTAKYQVNIFVCFHVMTMYKSLVDQSVLLLQLKKCEHGRARGAASAPRRRTKNTDRRFACRGSIEPAVWKQRDKHKVPKLPVSPITELQTFTVNQEACVWPRRWTVTSRSYLSAA